MKRNVLQLIGTFELGGTERQAVQLSRQLHDDGTYQVFVGCLDSSGPLRKEAQRISRDVIPEFKLNSFYDVNFWAQVRRCVAYLREREIGVIHTHDFYTNIFGMMAGFIAGVPVRIASKRNTFSKTRNQMLVERQAFRAADCILVNGDAVRALLVRKGVPERKVVRVFNGIDLDRFENRDEHSRSDRFRRLGLDIPNLTKIVTIVANLRSDVKNHEMFLRTAKRIRAEFLNVSFVIAGEGELTSQLKAKAAEQGIAASTHFIGRCDDIPGLLAVSDVCMLTSRSEGSPNAILEYMAAGKPVVATAVGGIPEVVDDGKSGFLVASDDDEMAAERVLTLLNDPEMAADFGKYGKHLVTERYSLSYLLRQTIALYDELMSTKSRPKVRERI